MRGRCPAELVTAPNVLVTSPVHTLQCNVSASLLLRDTLRNVMQALVKLSGRPQTIREGKCWTHPPSNYPLLHLHQEILFHVNCNRSHTIAERKSKKMLCFVLTHQNEKLKAVLPKTLLTKSRVCLILPADARPQMASFLCQP